jgi:hypothetical protein
MARPFTDIAKSKSANPIKNGSAVTTTTRTNQNTVYNDFVQNTPTIENIQSKYGNKFYNGIFVELVGNSTVVGG